MKETYEQRQRRSEAAHILDSSEMIMWYAAARNESIPQTRRHYQNIVLGLPQDPQEPVAWREEWEVLDSERVDIGIGMGASPARSSSGKGKERERDKDRDKGKKRMSSSG